MATIASNPCTIPQSYSWSCVNVFSVLKHVCPSVSCEVPYYIVLHTAEYIDSSSSLVCRCQLLIHRFQICLKLIAAISITFCDRISPWNTVSLTHLATVHSTDYNHRMVSIEAYIFCITWLLWSLLERFSQTYSSQVIYRMLNKLNKTESWPGDLNSEIAGPLRITLFVWFNY